MYSHNNFVVLLITIYIGREDSSSYSFGGSKVRIMEDILGMEKSFLFFDFIKIFE